MRLSCWPTTRKRRWKRLNCSGQSEVRGDLATRTLAEATRGASLYGDRRIAVSRCSATGVAPYGLIAATVVAALLVVVGVREWIAVHHAAAIAESKAPKLDLPDSLIEKPADSTMADARDLRAERSVAEVFSFTGRIGPQQRMLMEQMSVGLKPVTHSMSAALHALRRTLPGSETPARSS